MNEAVINFKRKIGQSNWERLMKRLNEVNRDIRSQGIHRVNSITGGLAGVGSELLTGYSYGEFYDWDLYFENIYLSYYGISRFCRTNLEEFLKRQLASGFVARTLVNPRMRQHFKPFLAQIALLGCRQFKNTDWLKWKYYDRLKKYLDYWFWFSDHDKNGLAVWDSADHSGMDNQVSRSGELFSQRIEGVDLNCYLVRELQAMAVLARLLGKPKDQDQFNNQAAELSHLINQVFWHEVDSFYYDRDERTGELVRVKSAAGFTPLWTGTAPQNRIEQLVSKHLLNQEEFWLAHPIATYAKTEPDYYQEPVGPECNWRGPTWIPVNYMVFHGLVKAGYTKEAEVLAYKTFELVINEETTREYYNAETGSGFGLNPFWGWSALGYLMPLEFESGYDPTDIQQTEILPICQELLGLELKL